jgi:hypothetical protein
MDAEQIAIYIGLLTQAAAAGERIYNGVKTLLHKELTPEENAAVMAQWDDNARRAAANAGINPDA